MRHLRGSGRPQRRSRASETTNQSALDCAARTPTVPERCQAFDLLDERRKGSGQVSYQSIVAPELEQLEVLATAIWGATKLYMHGDSAEYARAELEAIYDSVRTLDALMQRAVIIV